MVPDFVTFTGADDRTSVDDMRELSMDFPVEYGILLSGNREGTPRYPSRRWVESLKGSRLMMSAHLCGAYAKEVVITGKSSLADQLSIFERIQINTNMELDIRLLSDFGRALSDRHGHKINIILQTRGAFPEEPDLEWLFDASGGLGKVPDCWPLAPKRPDVRFGYAGGISPANIAQTLHAIPASGKYWIDMETGIRNANDMFDLGLCREVCQVVHDISMREIEKRLAERRAAKPDQYEPGND